MSLVGFFFPFKLPITSSGMCVCMYICILHHMNAVKIFTNNLWWYLYVFFICVFYYLENFLWFELWFGKILSCFSFDQIVFLFSYCLPNDNGDDDDYRCGCCCHHHHHHHHHGYISYVQMCICVCVCWIFFFQFFLSFIYLFNSMWFMYVFLYSC